MACVKSLMTIPPGAYRAGIGCQRQLTPRGSIFAIEN
jgi:hypothetical protein